VVDWDRIKWFPLLTVWTFVLIMQSVLRVFSCLHVVTALVIYVVRGYSQRQSRLCCNQLSWASGCEPILGLHAVSCLETPVSNVTKYLCCPTCPCHMHIGRVMFATCCNTSLIYIQTAFKMYGTIGINCVALILSRHVIFWLMLPIRLMLKKIYMSFPNHFVSKL